MHIGLIGGFKTIDCAAIHVAALARAAASRL